MFRGQRYGLWAMVAMVVAQPMAVAHVHIKSNYVPQLA